MFLACLVGLLSGCSKEDYSANNLGSEEMRSAEISNPSELKTIQEAWVDAGFFVWTDNTKTALRITPLGAQQEVLPDVSDGEQLTSANTMFNYSYSAPSKLVKAPMFNTSNIKDFYAMFWNCKSLTAVPVLNTSNGTNFMGMFMGCTSLTTIPALNTSNGTTFQGMFSECASLTTISLLDTSKGLDFSGMFSECTSLTAVPALNTSNGSTFEYMFGYCSSLQEKPNLDLSKARNTSGMYEGTAFN